MTRLIDLNADLGEECGDDEAMLALVSTANLACGGHAGGGRVLTHAMRQAHELGVRVGAHPSYPDRDRFGRVSLLDELPGTALTASVAAQVETFLTNAASLGAMPSHVKAHGALYNDACVSVRAAGILIAGVQAASHGRVLPVLGMPGSVLEEMCRERHIPFVAEGFVDRAYTSDGTLVARTEPGAVHSHEDALVQALDLAAGRVRAVDGSVLDMPVATLCVHGDTPGAVAMAAEVRDALHAGGYTIGATW